MLLLDRYSRFLPSSAGSSATGTTTSTAAAAAATTATMATVALMYYLYWGSVNNNNDSAPLLVDDKNTFTHTDLLEAESSGYSLMLPSVSTITFYEGDISVAQAHLQERLAQIVRLNPWLEGHLVNNKSKLYRHHEKGDDADAVLQLRYVATDDAIGGQERPLKPSTFEVTEDMLLDENMDYKEMIKRVSHLNVLEGKSIVNTNNPLFRVTLIKMKQQKFAMFFSLSHTIGDGHTYYSVYAMLSKDVVPRQLIVERVKSFSKQLDVAMDGNDCNSWLASVGTSLNIIKTQLFSKAPNVVKCTIDSDWVESQKTLYQSQRENHDSSNLPAFVSTNDILTSAHFCSLDFDVGLMTMNFRNKFPGITENHAGNYKATVAYQRDDYAYPHLIRKSLAIYRRWNHQQALPKFWKSITCKVGGVTTWVSFYHEIILPGNIKHIYHIPYFRTEGVFFSDFGIFFKPNKQEIAILTFTRSFGSGASFSQLFAPKKFV